MGILHLRYDELADLLSGSDKREYKTELAQTDPKTCTLNGESIVTRRIPDLTFGLAVESQALNEKRTFDRNRLERALFHPGLGLVSDPKHGEVHVLFPWMVYEAKRWSGNCGDARRQVCEAAMVYLEMQGRLVQKSFANQGFVPRIRRSSSQVFALTSIGAHWHLIIGYQRRRKYRHEHKDHPHMSASAYVRNGIIGSI